MNPQFTDSNKYSRGHGLVQLRIVVCKKMLSCVENYKRGSSHVSKYLSTL